MVRCNDLARQLIYYKLLGADHEPSTALDSAIDPTLFLTYKKRWNLAKKLAAVEEEADLRGSIGKTYVKSLRAGVAVAKHAPLLFSALTNSKELEWEMVYATIAPLSLLNKESEERLHKIGSLARLEKLDWSCCIIIEWILYGDMDKLSEENKCYAPMLAKTNFGRLLPEYIKVNNPFCIYHSWVYHSLTPVNGTYFVHGYKFPDVPHYIKDIPDVQKALITFSNIVLCHCMLKMDESKKFAHIYWTAASQERFGIMPHNAKSDEFKSVGNLGPGDWIKSKRGQEEMKVMKVNNDKLLGTEVEIVSAQWDPFPLIAVKKPVKDNTVIKSFMITTKQEGAKKKYNTKVRAAKLFLGPVIVRGDNQGVVEVIAPTPFGNIGLGLDVTSQPPKGIPGPSIGFYCTIEDKDMTPFEKRVKTSVEDLSTVESKAKWQLNSSMVIAAVRLIAYQTHDWNLVEAYLECPIAPLGSFLSQHVDAWDSIRVESTVEIKVDAPDVYDSQKLYVVIAQVLRAALAFEVSMGMQSKSSAYAPNLCKKGLCFTGEQEDCAIVYRKIGSWRLAGIGYTPGIIMRLVTQDSEDNRTSMTTLKVGHNYYYAKSGQLLYATIANKGKGKLEFREWKRCDGLDTPIRVIKQKHEYKCKYQTPYSKTWFFKTTS